MPVAMSDDLFLDPPELDSMPLCEECGDHLLPHERDTCEACDRLYYGLIVAWIKGGKDRDLALAYEGVRPALH